MAEDKLDDYEKIVQQYVKLVDGKSEKPKLIKVQDESEED